MSVDKIFKHKFIEFKKNKTLYSHSLEFKDSDSAFQHSNSVDYFLRNTFNIDYMTINHYLNSYKKAKDTESYDKLRSLTKLYFDLSWIFIKFNLTYDEKKVTLVCNTDDILKENNEILNFAKDTINKFNEVDKKDLIEFQLKFTDSNIKNSNKSLNSLLVYFRNITDIDVKNSYIHVYRESSVLINLLPSVTNFSFCIIRNGVIIYYFKINSEIFLRDQVLTCLDENNPSSLLNYFRDPSFFKEEIENGSIFNNCCIDIYSEKNDLPILSFEFSVENYVNYIHEYNFTNKINFDYFTIDINDQRIFQNYVTVISYRNLIQNETIVITKTNLNSKFDKYVNVSSNFKEHINKITKLQNLDSVKLLNVLFKTGNINANSSEYHKLVKYLSENDNTNKYKSNDLLFLYEKIDKKNFNYDGLVSASYLNEMLFYLWYFGIDILIATYKLHVTASTYLIKGLSYFYDLKLTKVSDKVLVKNGDIIIFTRENKKIPSLNICNPYKVINILNVNNATRVILVDEKGIEYLTELKNYKIVNNEQSLFKNTKQTSFSPIVKKFEKNSNNKSNKNDLIFGENGIDFNFPRPQLRHVDGRFNELREAAANIP